jgi:hypothetical protein
VAERSERMRAERSPTSPSRLILCLHKTKPNSGCVAYLLGRHRISPDGEERGQVVRRRCVWRSLYLIAICRLSHDGEDEIEYICPI